VCVCTTKIKLGCQIKCKAHFSSCQTNPIRSIQISCVQIPQLSGLLFGSAEIIDDSPTWISLIVYSRLIGAIFSCLFHWLTVALHAACGTFWIRQCLRRGNVFVVFRSVAFPCWGGHVPCPLLSIHADKSYRRRLGLWRGGLCTNGGVKGCQRK